MNRIQRLQRHRDVAAARAGVRAGTDTLVVHGVITPSDFPCRVGYAVSRAVGSAVVRNRLRRQLRAVVASHAEDFPTGGLVLVRVQAAATSRTFVELEADLLRCVGRWRQRAEVVG